MLGSPSTALEFFLSKATARQHQRTAQQAPPAQALQACDQPPAAAAAGAARSALSAYETEIDTVTACSPMLATRAMPASIGPSAQRRTV